MALLPGGALGQAVDVQHEVEALLGGDGLVAGACDGGSNLVGARGDGGILVCDLVIYGAVGGLDGLALLDAVHEVAHVRGEAREVEGVAELFVPAIIFIARSRARSSRLSRMVVCELDAMALLTMESATPTASLLGNLTWKVFWTPRTHIWPSPYSMG